MAVFVVLRGLEVRKDLYVSAAFCHWLFLAIFLVLLTSAQLFMIRNSKAMAEDLQEADEAASTTTPSEEGVEQPTAQGEDDVSSDVKPTKPSCRQKLCRRLETAKDAVTARILDAHNAEIVLMRVMQALLFFICYVGARYSLDVVDTRASETSDTAFSLVVLVSLALLAFLVPRAVPSFLAHMVLPPFLDKTNMENLLSVASAPN